MDLVMRAIFKKLNYKEQERILIINFPKTIENNIKGTDVFTKIKKNLRGINEINFILIFITKKVEIEKYFTRISNSLTDDAVLWFAYPKKSSKNYKCDFNRDTGWEILGAYGYESVRMVAIDEDWSALRFRKVEKIKKMTRRKNMALSEEGKKKTKGE